MGINFKKPAPAVPVQLSAPAPKPPVEDHLDPPWDESAKPGDDVATELGFASTSVVNKQFDPQTGVTTVLAEKHKQEPVTPTVAPIPADKLAKVSVGAGRKVNLGNYESADVSIHLSLPTHVDNLDEAYVRITKWIEKKMDEALSNDVAPAAGK